MRIAQVVTYVSEDGAFGGPVSVAMTQCASLAARGHDVSLFAASDIPAPLSSDTDGFRLRLFPARRVARGLGFAGMYAPGLSEALRAEAHKLDVAHVHLARDLVTLPAARSLCRASVPYVAQPHGMIDASKNPLARPVDAFFTKPALRSAHRVLTLTDQERSDIRSVMPAALIEEVKNGVQITPPAKYGRRSDEVLFLARLHPRKRPMAFVEMASVIADARPRATFTIAGPDEGEGDRVRQAIASSRHADRIRMIGPVRPADTRSLIARAAAYVLPSFGEVFPMTILEAFQAGTPVVATDSLGIAGACTRYGAALVTDGSPAALAAAVTRILDDPLLAQQLLDGADRYLHAELDIEDVADQLEATYNDARGGAR